MEKNEQTTTQVEKTLSWIERVGNMIKRTGIRDIILGIMVLFIVVVVGKIAFDPTSFMDRIDKVRSERHAESVLKRINSYGEINSTMLAIQAETKADRVLIYETHNGGSNLANLPFLYVDLTYGIPKDEFDDLIDEYKNVRLSRYPWAIALYKYNVWSAPIEEMEAVDPELYYRLKKEEVDYFYAILLYGKDTLPCGFVALVYKDRANMPERKEFERIMLKYSNILAALLTPVVG